MGTRGILYVATDDRFLSEVYRSVESVREHMSELPITLYTSVPKNRVAMDWFSQVLSIPRFRSLSHPKEAKIASLAASPYEETLFLDSDTFLCNRVDELFDLLDTFDLGVAQDPNRYRTEDTAPGEIPRAFPEMNTGVMVLRAREPRLQALFRAWSECFQKTAHNVGMRDQPSFRKVLYESEVRLATLPPEYNYRFIYTGYATGPIHILHGRQDDLPLVKRIANADLGRRILLGLGHQSPMNRMRIFYRTMRSHLSQFLLLMRHAVQNPPQN